MQPTELKALVERVLSQKCETQTLEVKAAHSGCPTRLYPTLSGFSNQDDGGIILFGIDEKSGFQIVGVYDAQDLQQKVVEQCKQLEPVVRPLFSFCEIDGRVVAAIEIPSVDITERPVYYRGVGRVRGSYIRVGDADEVMSEYEIYSYDAFRRRVQDDLRIVENAKLTLFNRELLEEYITAVKTKRKNLAENVT
ncbi:MAG: ATP-binding protein, partial [Oscillospiraceae bacterium]|nr:ATP-binding protein [Oscillospiraceae bacterium]